MSHDGDGNAASRADLTKIYTWYAERIARLLDQLAAVEEGEGTLLDNTLVVWGSELGKGNSHAFERVPFVLAGGAGGALPTGRYLQFAGVPHNRLLVSICRAMGLSDLDQFRDDRRRQRRTGRLARLKAGQFQPVDRLLGTVTDGP